jgi:ribosome-associated protein
MADQFGGSYRKRSSVTSPSTACIRPTSDHLRQITCMTKTEKRRAPRRLTGDIGRAVRAALDKKASDVVLLDLRRTPAFTDFFVLCSGQNTRQVKAIADAVEEALRGAKVRPSHIEGYDRAEWILMDYFTFIVHVFTPQTRAFYSLERLWGDAERIEIAEDVS